MLHHHNPYIAHYARVVVIRLEQNILRIFDYLFSFRCLRERNVEFHGVGFYFFLETFRNIGMIFVNFYLQKCSAS